jgi:trans-aconitate methyltransferase
MNFVRFTKNPNYIAYNGEVTLLKSIIPNILDIRKISIYDLGPGDGSKAQYLLNRLDNVAKYTGIDISKDMLNIAKLKS